MRNRLISSLTFLLLINYLNATLINVPSDYSTIQTGIDSAINGDTVLVQPGTYNEVINFSGKSILVGSYLLTTGDTNYINYTTISGNSLNSSVITFDNGEDSLSKLIGFTIKDGRGNYRDPDGDSTFAKYGGGIYCENSSPFLSDITVKNNFASRGGGGGAFCYNSSPTFRRVKFISNSSNDVGGGLYCKNYSNPELNTAIFQNNNGFVGAAVYLRDYCTVKFTNLIATNNNSDIGGDFLWAKIGCNVSINKAELSANLNVMITCKNSSMLTIKNSSIYNSIIDIKDSSIIEIDSSWFYNNSIVLIKWGSNGILRYSTFYDLITSSQIICAESKLIIGAIFEL